MKIRYSNRILTGEFQWDCTIMNVEELLTAQTYFLNLDLLWRIPRKPDSFYNPHRAIKI